MNDLIPPDNQNRRPNFALPVRQLLAERARTITPSPQNQEHAESVFLSFPN